MHGEVTNASSVPSLVSGSGPVPFHKRSHVQSEINKTKPECMEKNRGGRAYISDLFPVAFPGVSRLAIRNVLG